MTNETPYNLISVDGHAGADDTPYRSYLESVRHKGFDAWRGKHQNAYRVLVDVLPCGSFATQVEAELGA